MDCPFWRWVLDFKSCILGPTWFSCIIGGILWGGFGVSFLTFRTGASISDTRVFVQGKSLLFNPNLQASFFLDFFRYLNESIFRWYLDEYLDEYLSDFRVVSPNMFSNFHSRDTLKYPWDTPPRYPFKDTSVHTRIRTVNSKIHFP